MSAPADPNVDPVVAELARGIRDIAAALASINARLERIERDAAAVRDVAMAAQQSEGWAWLPTRKGGR